MVWPVYRDLGEVLLLLPIFLVVYFFPSIAAWLRGKKNFEAIFLLNFLAGWTFVGWVIAIVWAAMRYDAPPQVGAYRNTPLPPASGLIPCPSCSRRIPRNLTRCMFCRGDTQVRLNI